MASDCLHYREYCLDFLNSLGGSPAISDIVVRIVSLSLRGSPTISDIVVRIASLSLGGSPAVRHIVVRIVNNDDDTTIRGSKDIR